MLSPDTRIYVKIDGKKYVLPVNPEEIQVDHPYVDKTAEVAGVGEILIPQKPGLREVTFSSFLPGDDYDPYVHDYKSPRKVAKALERAWKERTICRLIISRSIDYDTNMRCVISDWKISDRGGEPNDLYYDITFREYRSYGVSQMTVISETGTVVTGPGANLTPADGQFSVRIDASTTTQRAVDTPVLVTGASVWLNGTAYTDSSASDATGVQNGVLALLTRIESGNPAPYYVAGFGWFKADALSLEATI